MKKIYELITEEKLILKPPLKIDEVIKQFFSNKNNMEMVSLSSTNFDQPISIRQRHQRLPKNSIVIMFIIYSDYFTTSTFKDILHGFHTYHPDKTSGCFYEFNKNCYTSTHMANFPSVMFIMKSVR